MDDEKNQTIRILHLEDAPQDAELIRVWLTDSGFSLQVDWATNKQEFTVFLECGGYDLVLADYRLPEFEAPEALALTRSLCPGLPFIALTGAVGEEKAVELLKQGATDYILKDQLAKLPLAIKRALHEVKELEARRSAEEALVRLNEELEWRVIDRTAELERKNAELENLNKLFVGRELRMIELKERIKDLERKVSPEENPKTGA